MSRDGPTFPLVPRKPISGIGLGTTPSRRRGPGFDLAGSRAYRPGDDVRRIDHRASARLASAAGSDEFVVREYLTEEVARVVIVVDRRPAMQLFPDGLPWLHKPSVIAEAGSMIVDSAVSARCLVGYLDDADAHHPKAEKREGSPFWRPPDGQTESWLIKERFLPYPGFFAPEESLAQALEGLASLKRALPPGTFVFLLSDFLVFPPRDAWTKALLMRWDIVPVVISDPLWEQSFPDVEGSVLSLADPATGRVSLVRLTRAEARRRRGENEARLDATLDEFAAMGLDWVLLSEQGRGAILGEFLAWSEARSGTGRLAW